MATPESQPVSIDLPLVDLTHYNINTEQSSLDDGHIKELASEIRETLANYGFLRVKNHGIDEKQVDRVIDEWKNFFQQPLHMKNKYARRTNAENYGYVCLEKESLNPRRPADFKEAFNVMSQRDMTWPTDPSNLRDLTDKFYDDCKKLTEILLHLIGVGLLPQDPYIFRNAHHIKESNNSTGLRSLFYPSLERGKELLKNQIRCGEHSDYGSLTILFQDNVGGLELLTKTGQYVPVKPVPGSACINIGDLMQRWTSDKIMSTKHRVVFADGNESEARLSLAFFAHPDDDYLVQCLDGSDMYEPITSLDYLHKRYNDTYK